MKIQDLSKNPNNPRKITEAKQKMLLKALRRFGDLSGIVYNRKSKQLVGGHQRRDIFSPDTPIVINKKYSTPTKTGTVAEGYVDAKGERFSYREVYWDEPTEKAANIAANKGAGEWDPAKLKDWILELNSFDVNFDLDLTMFDPDEIKDITGIEVKGYTRTNEKTGVDEDEIPEKPPAQTKLGDIYLLGRHRLMCGDSTNAASVEKLFDGHKPDVCITDPPYSVNYDRSKAERGGKDEVHDHYNEADIDPTSLLTFMEHMDCDVLVMSYPIDRHFFTLADTFRKYDLEFRKELVWVKDTFSFWMSAKYQQRHEPILWCVKRGKPLGGEVPANQSTVFEFPRPRSHELHPTAKPVELWSMLVKHHTPLAGIVYEPFCGSGTTIIAAEKNGVRCFGMEMAPAYCDVIVARWEKYTGLKAKLVRAETKTKRASQAKVQANGKSKPQAAPEA